MSFLTAHLVEVRRDSGHSDIDEEYPDSTVYEIQHAPDDPDRPVALTLRTDRNHWGSIVLDRPHPYMAKNEEAYFSLSDQASFELVDRAIRREMNRK